MKNFLHYFSTLAVATIALVSCNKSEIDVPSQNGYTYSFNIVDDLTKATLDNGGVLWENGDQVGLFIVDSEDNDVYTGYANVDVSTTPKTVKLYSRQTIPAKSKAYAYYPYNENNNDAELALVNFSEVQKGGSASAMPMAGIPFIVEDDVPLEDGKTSTTTNGEIKFLNLGAIIDFKIYSSDYSDENVQYVTFTATGKKNFDGSDASENAVSGDALLDLTDVDYGNATSLAPIFGLTGTYYDYAKVNQQVAVATTKEDATPIYLVVAPGIYTGTITIGTDAATYTFNYSNKELARNVVKHYNMNLNNATRVAGAVESSVKVTSSSPYTETFANRLGEFTTNEVIPASEVGDIWAANATYVKAKAYANKTNYASEAWLISPWIDLSEVANASVSFEHVYRYDSDYKTHLTLQIETNEENADWAPLTIPAWSTGKDWNFVNSQNIALSEYVGKTVKIAFKYVSDKSTAATWQIKNFTVQAQKGTAGISYAEEDRNLNAVINDEDFTAPTLINPHNLTVTYSSSDDKIILVDENTGEALIGDKEGTATVTATFAGNADYEAAEASYKVTVKDPNSVVTKGAMWSYTFTSDDFASASTNYSGTYNGKTLTFNSTLKKNAFETSGSARGVQFGSAKGEFTITISGYSDGVQSVKLLVSTNGTTDNNTIDVKVNNTTLGEQVKLKKENNYEIDFAAASPLEGGDIVLAINDKVSSVYLKSIVINEVVKTAQSLSFAESAVEWIVGTDCALNTAQQGQTVSGAKTSVSYESSDDTVAEVDNSGKVTPKKPGTVTITATAEENEDYYSASDSYELTITDPNATTVDHNASIKFGTNNVNIDAASVTGKDSEGNEWTITTEGTTSFTKNASYYQVGSSKVPATSITFTTTLPKEATITAMSAKFGGFNGTEGTVTLKVGDTTIGTGSLAGTTDVTVSATTTTALGKVLTVTVTGISKGVKVYNIDVTYNN